MPMIHLGSDDAEAWLYRMSECGTASYKAESISDLQMAVLFQFS